MSNSEERRAAMNATTLDAQDQDLLNARQRAIDGIGIPRVGDIVIYADHVERRISHNWTDWGDGYEATDSGSWYLGPSVLSFTGDGPARHVPLPSETLTCTGETRRAPAWFFHHNVAGVNNSVEVTVIVRVYRCRWASGRRR